MSLLCVSEERKETERQKERSVSMANGISITGGVNTTRKVPGFQHSTVLYPELNVEMNDGAAVRVCNLQTMALMSISFIYIVICVQCVHFNF